RGSCPDRPARWRRTACAMPAPSPPSHRPLRRSLRWPPRQQPAATPAPAIPADAAPTAPAPTSPTFRAHRQTTATALLGPPSHHHTQQHINYLRDIPLATLDQRVLVVGSGGLSHDPPIPTLKTATPTVAERIVHGRPLTPEQRLARQIAVIDAARS